MKRLKFAQTSATFGRIRPRHGRIRPKSGRHRSKSSQIWQKSDAMITTTSQIIYDTLRWTCAGHPAQSGQGHREAEDGKQSPNATERGRRLPTRAMKNAAGTRGARLRIPPSEDFELMSSATDGNEGSKIFMCRANGEEKESPRFLDRRSGAWGSSGDLAGMGRSLHEIWRNWVLPARMFAAQPMLAVPRWSGRARPDGLGTARLAFAVNIRAGSANSRQTPSHERRCPAKCPNAPPLPTSDRRCRTSAGRPIQSRARYWNRGVHLQTFHRQVS